MNLFRFLAIGVGALASTAALANAPTTMAKADGKGNVDLHIVYFAENTCVRFADVRDGSPGNIETPKRTLVVTVTLDRSGSDCRPELRTIEHDLRLADREGVLSVDIFFVDPDGRFVRSARPRIYRAGDLEE